MRGLFLRSYLLQCVGPYLPDVGNESEENGSCQDSISFVLQNFTEMNRLWVRMQSSGKSKKRRARDKERAKLKMLIGRNINTLTNLEGVTIDVYVHNVLPKVLEEVQNCKDVISQGYLMDAIIASVPIEKHFKTLHTLLDVVLTLENKVDVCKYILYPSFML